ALNLMLLTFGLWLLFDRNYFVSGFFFFFLSINRIFLLFFYCTVHLFKIIEYVTWLCTFFQYVCFQILVLVMQMAILVLIIMKKEEVHNQWNNKIDDFISEYRSESLTEQESVWNILNAMQQNMECCERYNATQWEVNKVKNNIIQFLCSCAKYNLKKCDVPRDSTYSVGCEEHLSTLFENNAPTLIAITITLLSTQVRLL
ncbi:CD82 protein, partial [Leiothrix lutea]|nr:CD82 protein [Leiothrix lutea]